MRRPYTLYKLAHSPVYRIAFWAEASGRYQRRSAASIRRQLSPRADDLSPTTRAGAEAIARLALEAGIGPRDTSSFLAYTEAFWAEGSDYLRSREARQKPLSAVYAGNCRRAVSKYLQPYLQESGQLGLQLGRVNADTLEGFVLWLRGRGLGPSSINGILKAVRVPLGRAARTRRILYNPAGQVERLPDPPPARRILELEEARKFFALPWADARYYAANLAAATTGMRLGEIRGLQAEDLREDSIHVCHNWQDHEPAGRQLKGPKHSTLANIKSRDVPMPPVLARVLRELADRNPYGDGFVIWGDRAGAPPSSTIILRHFKAALRAIGIEEPERRERHLSMHAWRHWFNTHIRPLIPAYQLRMLTGHANEAMTDRYTAAAITDEQRQAVESVAAGLLPGGAATSPAPAP
jgi:integrase